MKPTEVPGPRQNRRAWWRLAGRLSSWALGLPTALIVVIYLVLLVTPIPLPFAGQQVRNLLMSSLPPDSELELGEMALALEGLAFPVIQFTPVKFTNKKTGGVMRIEALEIGFSPWRALIGQPGASVTVVGPHLQINQDLFGPRLANFEYEDAPDGTRTVRVIEGADAFPQVSLSADGVNVMGELPSANVGMRSDNDWLVYNLEAAAQGVAGIVEQAKAGTFSKLTVRGGVLEMNDALYGVFRTFRDISMTMLPGADAKSASGEFSLDFGGSRMGGLVEWTEEGETARMRASLVDFNPSSFMPVSPDEEALASLVGTMAVSLDLGFSLPEVKVLDGLFHLDMTGMDLKIGEQTLPIATSIAQVRWDPPAGQFTMEETQFIVGDNSAFVKGQFGLGLDPQYGPTVSISMSGRDIVIPSDLGPPAAPFPSMQLNGWSAPLYGATGIDQFELKAPGGGEIVSEGRIDMLRKGAGFQMTIAGEGITAEELKRVWPPMVSKDSRDWFIKNIPAGRLKASSMRYDFPIGSIDTSVPNQPMPKNSVFIDIVGEGVEVTPVPGMDPIKVQGDMKLTVRDSDVTISADGGVIETKAGEIAIANFGMEFGSDTPDESFFELSGDVSGDVPSLVELIKDHQPQALADAKLPLDPAALSGDMSVSVVLTTTLDKATGAAKKTDYVLNGVLQDFGSSAPLQGHTIGNGQLSFLVSQASYRLTGQADIDGIPANLLIDGVISENVSAPNIELSAEVDVADFKKFGLDASEFLSGRLRFAARPLADGSIQVAVDLKNAGVVIKDLGLDKAVGVDGEAQATIKQTGDIAEVTGVKLAFGEVALEGDVSFDVKQGLKKAEFSKVALSPGDSAQLSVAPADDGFQIRVRGQQLDFKPMLQRFFSLSGESTGGPQATAVRQTLYLDVELDRAVGFYKTTAFNLNLDLALRGSDLRRVTLQANFGDGRNISVATNPTPDGRVMSVAFNDLGTLLRLLNIYPNLEGGEGTLVVNTDTANKTDTGQFTLRRFAIVNEDNVAQIMRTDRASQQMIERSNKLSFRAAEVEFIRRTDRVEITDAVLTGDSVGGTARGFIYTDRRQYDLTGTYVPLFGLNNAFGKLLGPLAGRDGEGLFGVTFAVRGPLDKPEFKVNPMSALVPGAFRRMFEYRAREIPRAE